jgi:hypothetical protein
MVDSSTHGTARLRVNIARMDDDISKLFRQMKDVSVSFTPDDLIQNMTSIGHIKKTETNPNISWVVVDFQFFLLNPLIIIHHNSVIDVICNYDVIIEEYST